MPEPKLPATVKFHRPARQRSAVPIVPMIDILLFMLIFSVVTTTFKRPRSVVRIELPVVHEVPSESVTETRSVISVDATGKVTLDAATVPDGLLDSYLSAYQKTNPGRKLELEADKSLPLEKLLAVWDALTKAGFPVKDVPARIRLPTSNPPSGTGP